MILFTHFNLKLVLVEFCFIAILNLAVRFADERRFNEPRLVFWFFCPFCPFSPFILHLFFFGFLQGFSYVWQIFSTNFFNEFWFWFFNFFFPKIFFTYNLLTIASFRIGVPLILLLSSFVQECNKYIFLKIQGVSA